MNQTITRRCLGSLALGVLASSTSLAAPTLAPDASRDELAIRLAKATGYIAMDDDTMDGLYDLWAVPSRLSPASVQTVEDLRDMVSLFGVSIFDAAVYPAGAPLPPAELESLRADVEAILVTDQFAADGTFQPAAPWVDELMLTAVDDLTFVTPLALFMLVHSTMQGIVADNDLFSMAPEVQVELRIGELMGITRAVPNSVVALEPLMDIANNFSPAARAVIDQLMAAQATSGLEWPEFTRTFGDYITPQQAALLATEVRDGLPATVGGPIPLWASIILEGSGLLNPMAVYMAVLGYYIYQGAVHTATVDQRWAFYVNCMWFNCVMTRIPRCTFTITGNGNFYTFRCACPPNAVRVRADLPVGVSIPWKNNPGRDFARPWGRTIGKEALAASN